MFQVLRRRNFAFLSIAGFLSAIGNFALITALPFYVYQTTGSAVATGGLMIVQVLPVVLFGSIAGVYVDRWDPRRTMLVADLARTLIVLLLLLSPVLGVWIVYVVGFAETVFSLFSSPAFGASIPRIVGVDQLTEAYSVSSTSGSLAQIIGPALGGAILGVLGLPSVILLDAVSYLASGLMVYFVTLPVPARDRSEAKPGMRAAVAGVWVDWTAGLQQVRFSKVLTGLFLLMAIASFSDGFIGPLFVPWVSGALHKGAVELGWLLTAQGVGGVVGGMVASHLAKRMSPQRLIPLTMALAALLMFTIFNTSRLDLSLVLLTLLGIPSITFLITTNAVLQQSTADSYRGRILGSFGTSNALARVMGIGVGGFLGDRLGVLFTLNLSVTIFLLAAAVPLLTLQAIPVAAEDTPVAEKIPGSDSA